MRIETECDHLHNIKTHYLTENSTNTTYQILKPRNLIVYEN